MVKRPKFPTSEYFALQDLYASTNGSFWHWLNTTDQSIPWNFTNPTVNPCLDNWQGITCSCSIVICSVSMLILESHNLIGRLPDSIGQLSNLTILNLKRNQLTGIIPQEISRFKSLILLDLSINALTGPIPSTINNLQHTLQIIELRTNSLNYLPETFWNLTNLQIISLGENSFHQPLSCSIQQLIQLKSLNLEYNYFTSTLPDCFHNLQLLKNIQLSENKFIGKLPSSLFLLTNLISFALGSNEFTGTIPFDFNRLIQLKSLYLNKNSFYGNLSSCFYCSLNQLKIFSISNNYLTGTIPLQLSIQFNQSLHFLYLECNSFYGNIQFLNSYDQLIAFQLNNNFFTGNIDNNNDSQLFSNHQLKLINCAFNLLTGNLPYSSYWKIDTYQMNNNYLFSTISNDFHSFPTLLYFLLQNNYIYSAIPDVFMENTSRLEYLNLGNNLITGSISSSFLENVQIVTQLLLDNNRLTNTIPIELINNQRLVVLSLYSNQLIGTFPKEIIPHLYQLEELLLQNNQLTGSINNILNMTNKHSRINTIDISNNLFTGTIPDAIFHQPYLQSLLISSNCLKGSIPLTICNSRILQSFSMDGYSTAINCRIPIFNSNNRDLFGDYFNGFTLSNYLEGGIPNCLFELPTIQSLHLSGLGSYGHLPDNINLSNNLTDLSLSHNLFTGTIPFIFQEKDWMNLDLSYNKFTGTLTNTSFNNEDDDNSETCSLSLQVNRLSGTIPSSLLTMENISILTGNIFECDVVNPNLPKADSASNTYSCGSNNVNYVLYCWLVIFVIAPLLALLMYELMIKTKERNEEGVGESHNTSLGRRWTPTKLCQRTIEILRSSYLQMILWKNFLRENNNPSLRRFSRYHEEIRSLAFYIMMYCMFITLPVYSILTIYYSSYMNEYAWTISAMLLIGFNAGIVLFFLFLFFVIMIILLIQSLVYRVQDQDLPPNDSSTSFFQLLSRKLSKLFFRDSLISDFKPARTSSVSDSRWVVGMVYFTIFILNVMIMSIADFSYVYIVITYDTYISSITAFFLAFFRIITNNLLLLKALPWVTTFYSNKIKICHISQHSIHLLNNHQYSNQDISFLELLILLNNIVIPIFAVMCILPDCFYNALFSSSRIQTSYTLQTCNGYVTNDESTSITDPFYFCNPVIQEVSYVPPFIYSYQCSSKIIINYVPVYTVMFLFVSLLSPLFHILCHIWYNASILRSKDTLTFHQRMIMKWIIPNHIKELQILQNHYLHHYRHYTLQMNQQSDHNNNNHDNIITTSVMSLPVEFKIFSKLTLSVNIHSYLAIILSFGILFPPLAFIGYVAINILTIYEESNVARVLLQSISIGNYSYVEIVGKEFDGVEGSMSLTLWSTLFVCCGLYAYIIFDTIGDAIGWLPSLPLALLMFFLPFTLWFMKMILRRCGRQHDEREVSLSQNTQTMEKERSISSIQMISRPSNVISSNSVENPILIKDLSLPIQT